METQALMAYIMDSMEGGIHGRVQLQKLIYFCKACGTAVDANYKLYIYGPYSQQVTDSLQEGVMNDIFHEIRGLISKGTEFQRYITAISENAPLSHRQEEIIHAVLDTFGGMHTDQLEILATTFFIYRQQSSLFGNADKTSVLDKVRRAKSSRFTEAEIVNSYSEMEEICFPLVERFA